MNATRNEGRIATLIKYRKHKRNMHKISPDKEFENARLEYLRELAQLRAKYAKIFKDIVTNVRK